MAGVHVPPSLQKSAQWLLGRMLAPQQAGPEHQLRAGHPGVAAMGRWQGTEAPGLSRGAQWSGAGQAGQGNVLS